jgi:hypothetical protein
MVEDAAAAEEYLPVLLASKGLPIRSIEAVRPSLEDVFVALVHREGGAVLG